MTFGQIGEDEPKCSAIGTSLEIASQGRRITLQFKTVGVNVLSMLAVQKGLHVTEDTLIPQDW